MANLNIAIAIAAKDSASGPIGSIKSALGGLADAAGRGFSGLQNIAVLAGGAAIAGVGALGAGMTALVVSTAGAADELVELSDKTGLTTTQLQEFKYIGEQTGTSVETVTGSLAKLVRNMDSAARTGKGAAADAFKKLGVSVTDANGHLRNSQDVFGDAINALGDVGNETERDALAMAIFGKSAQELNPLINAGSDGIAAMSKQAHDLGAVMSEEAVSGLAELNDMIAGLKMGFQGWMGTLASAFLPVFREVIGAVEDFMASPAVREGLTNFIAGIATYFEGAAARIASFVDNLQAGMSPLAAFIEAIRGLAPPEVLNFIADGAGRVADAFRNSGIGAAILEFGTVIGEGLGAAWESTIKPKLLEWASGFWDWLTGPGGATSTLSEKFTTVIAAITDFITTNWPTIQAALTEWNNKFWDWVLGPGGALEKTATALDAIMLNVQTWVTNNQPRLEAEGVRIGGFMMDALTVLFNNQEKVNSVIGTLLASIGRAVVAFVSASNAAGASIGSGIINGMIDHITGENANSSLVQALKDLVSQVLMAFNPIQQITNSIGQLSSGGGSSSGSGWIPGFASGGSFIVPGSGSGDRPFTMGLTPGERVSISPAGGGGGGVSIGTITINASSYEEGQAAGRGLVEELRSRGLM